MCFYLQLGIPGLSNLPGRRLANIKSTYSPLRAACGLGWDSWPQKEGPSDLLSVALILLYNKVNNGNINHQGVTGFTSSPYFNRQLEF